VVSGAGEAPRVAAGYRFADALPAHTHSYLWPTVLREVRSALGKREAGRVLDLGCGNGAFCAELAAHGYDVVGIDPSTDGIAHARRQHPTLRVFEGSAYEPLAAAHGRFDVVVSLEVVEHLYSPRRFADCLHDLLTPGGIAIVSTPYHGYLKNLALALTGSLDRHFSPLWEHGHVKFWSIATLTTLLRDAGFQVLRFERVGRIAPFAKSMIAVARRTAVE
jgi:2-polyprenyl-3-methyl-5-hydroxy-6-metoxy-1,4-benzoquinol methylase